MNLEAVLPCRGYRLQTSMRIVLRIILPLLITSALFPRPAHAYIDPMSGSIIFQALTAGFLAALLLFKRFWWRVAEACKRIWRRITH
ncbi:MAG: hypothetical protein ACREX3_04650 [Gammaproteobacteria bacterium]